MIKICGLALVAAAAGVILRGIKASDEVKNMLEIIAYCALAAAGIVSLSAAFTSLSDMVGDEETGKYMETLLRALGIGYSAEITADICAAAGSAQLASAVIFAGRVGIFSVALPLASELLSSAVSML
ncbi:MAG: stage III sporulation AC/AD family protein [Firmicutes bacterium]|nr:stage III sporulation AC/AD family protein [Bacillota bacterium]MCD8055990.1 stage III sporulation AC/AD family protein [Clostridiales bacterium]MCD7782553.1 stage III sporulation AC/AD family protein [Bacillota bacterium]MCD7788357.1 stage III sporulation AC/AD family protein [Bacillota bacterium]MCD7831036.1 stage III sporulation AC/AD family protein [Bacillota bacterium]